MDEPGSTDDRAAGPVAKEQDGVRLEVVPGSATIDAGGAVTFRVTMTNARLDPLQYGSIRDCFVLLSVEVPVPRTPIGRMDWTGPAAAFKQHVLTDTPQQPGDIDTGSTSIALESPDCPAGNGITSPLGTLATLSATFTWDGSFGSALPIPPARAALGARVLYATDQPPVTAPPPPAQCPCPIWEPAWKELKVDGTLSIGGAARPMRGIGQVLDSALADATFREFIETEPFETCTINLSLPAEQATYLPPGPGWNLEVICDDPRHFIRVEIDPWTAAVKGLDTCHHPCQR